jgi:hypothetical protein
VVHSAKEGLAVHVVQAVLMVHSAKAGLVFHVVQAVLLVHVGCTTKTARTT